MKKDDEEEEIFYTNRNENRIPKGVLFLLRAVDWGMPSAGRVAPQENPRRAPIVLARLRQGVRGTPCTIPHFLL